MRSFPESGLRGGQRGSWFLPTTMPLVKSFSKIIKNNKHLPLKILEVGGEHGRYRPADFIVEHRTRLVKFDSLVGGVTSSNWRAALQCIFRPRALGGGRLDRGVVTARSAEATSRTRSRASLTRGSSG
jgi:hypothetical protein